MTPPRPADPDALWAEFSRHQQTCTACTDAGLCPDGNRILKAWCDSDDYYANEQATIDAVEGVGVSPRRDETVSNSPDVPKLEEVRGPLHDKAGEKP